MEGRRPQVYKFEPLKMSTPLMLELQELLLEELKSILEDTPDSLHAHFSMTTYEYAD